MSPRAFAALVALAVAGGCGNSAASTTPSAVDVKGAPLRAEKPADLPPPTAPALATAASTPAAAAPTIAAPAVAPVAEKAPPDPPAAAPETSAADFQSVSFDELAGFDFALYGESPKAKHEIPEKIRALSGKRVVVDGYMMPLQYEAGGAKKFLLMKNQFGCCYAATPKQNEWIEVTMEGGAVADYIHLQLVTVYGTMEVKTAPHDGPSTGLYAMKSTRTEFTEAK